MFKVFRPDVHYNPLLLGTQAHDLPFHIEFDKFLMVENIKDADIIPLFHPDDNDPSGLKEKFDYINEQGGITRNQIILIMQHTHISNGYGFQQHIERHIAVWKQFSDYVYHVNVNSKDKINIFYDFHWNRQKAYFIDYDKYDLVGRLCTDGATKKMYAIDEIVRHGTFKHFLVPNRVLANRGLENRNVVRQKIHEAIHDAYCFRGNPESGQVLDPQEINPAVTEYMKRLTAPLWFPISSKYYARSFVSVYAESVTVTGASESITEKTLDPMIKGHFVLPFGHSGLVRDIRKMGFLLPDWIDYSYDTILDDSERLQAFLASVAELQQKSIEELHKLYVRDRYILLQNRHLFTTKPYDSLHDKVMERYKADKNN